MFILLLTYRIKMQEVKTADMPLYRGNTPRKTHHTGHFSSQALVGEGEPLLMLFKNLGAFVLVLAAPRLCYPNVRSRLV